MSHKTCKLGDIPVRVRYVDIIRFGQGFIDIDCPWNQVLGNPELTAVYIHERHNRLVKTFVHRIIGKNRQVRNQAFLGIAD